METDQIVLERREKEVSYGKNTQDYLTYIMMVLWKSRSPSMPRTPDHRKFGRRQ